MLNNTIDFIKKEKYGNIHFKLQLQGKVTQVLGDNATGKSFFGRTFAAEYKEDVLYIDYTWYSYRELIPQIIANFKGSYIIFDNFDVLGGKAFESFLEMQSEKDDKIYIIFSRDFLAFVPLYNVCVMKHYTVKNSNGINEVLYVLDYTKKG